jgi:hypothetical protein
MPAMTLDEAIGVLVEAAEDWRDGARDRALDVVHAACEVLVAGHDGMAVATLAGVERADAKDKVADFLVEALAEVGVPFFLPGSDAEQRPWLASMADRLLIGVLSPRELAQAVSSAVGSDGCTASRRLVHLALQYFLADEHDFDAWDPDEIDAAVLAEAQRLSGHA